MSDFIPSKQYHQGAKVTRSNGTAFVEKALTELEWERLEAKRRESLASEAYLLAKANENKPWAKRWLKFNGHRI